MIHTFTVQIPKNPMILKHKYLCLSNPTLQHQFQNNFISDPELKILYYIKMIPTRIGYLVVIVFTIMIGFNS